MEYVIDVGWTSQRPIIPEQHTSRVQVWADSAVEAEVVAQQIVQCRPSCVMATSSLVLV